LCAPSNTARSMPRIPANRLLHWPCSPPYGQTLMTWTEEAIAVFILALTVLAIVVASAAGLGA
jgi:hypothetical protein